MHIIDKNILLNNSGNDEKIANELLDMGLTRINESLTEMKQALDDDDWNALARSIHRLRPIINFCGITIINEELLNIEIETKENKKINHADNEIERVFEILESAKEQIIQLLNTI
ncbi:MAG TPA: hypothetical protein VJ963_03715 [Bacteroidales bacterium]|nr:hypothetical protein [Bacteroidales bacterium]